MSNRRVKSLALDEDDYDEYDEYDADDNQAGTGELSPKDRENMRIGTIQVREALGPTVVVSDKDIHDALWHYYYDIAKSVAYLKNKHKPASVASKKQSRGGHDAWNPTESVSQQAAGHPRPPHLPSPPGRITFSAAEFFQDCPWLRIPEHRRADIIIESLHPRRGLLGGVSNTGKTSKLAALAAKRRQKEAEQSAAASTDPTSVAGENYIASLNKLRLGQPSKRSADAAPAGDITAAPSASIELASMTTAVTDNATRPETHGVPVTAKAESALQTAADLRATPSNFASIMTSHDPDARSWASLNPSAVEGLTESFDFTEPSPDDVVTKAQTIKAPKPKTPNAAKPSANLANGVKDLSIQDTPAKIQHKHLDVVSEYKKTRQKNAANFVVIGHVDAGKSTLMGRLLFDLKAIDERTMEKYRKEADRIGKGSFAFAWILDQDAEERVRGVTIDIATNKFETDKTSFTILDAPGHRDFVPNMIAGASQADFAVLVIDASTGNFESGLKGQTKEHALLVRSIGVQRIIVAVNKMDVAAWSRSRFDEIRHQMSAFLTTAGFQPKNVAFVPCSGLEGQNILSRVTDARASWHQGPTLVDELDKSEPSTRALEKPLRMTINDVFRGSIQNPLSVSGRLDAGTVQIGESVLIMPSGEKAQIRSLEVDDEPRDWAVAGQNVVLNLTDIDAIHFKSGDVLCSPTAAPIKNITEFTAKLLAFDHLTPMNVDVHKGRLHVPGRIVKLIGVLDKASGLVVKKKPKIVQPGNVVRVVVQLEQPVPLEAPARVVLRAMGETVAAGLIE